MSVASYFVCPRSPSFEMGWRSTCILQVKATLGSWNCNIARSRPVTLPSRRNLKYIEKLPPTLLFFTATSHIYGRKECFPVSPTSMKWVHKQSQNKLGLSVSSCQLSVSSLVLCYISVHFAILWRSCQIFPLNESFNALLDDYRTGKKPCPKLLGDLQTIQTQENSMFPVCLYTLEYATT